MKRIALAVFAVGVVAAIAYAAPDTEPNRSNYQQYQHKAPQLFEKELRAFWIDAGTGSKIAGKNIAVAQAQDGGLGTSFCQFGHKALTNGDAGVTFRTAFGSIPSCTCSGTVAGGNACQVSTASTTAIGMSIQSADTAVAHYVCCGDL